MSDNLSQIALFNASSTSTSDNLSQKTLFNASNTPMSDILQALRGLTTPMSDILLIVNIFSDIGVLFRFEMADYLP